MDEECTATCPPLVGRDVVNWPGDRRGTGAPSRRPDHPGTDRELRRPAPGMAPALLRVLRHLPPRPRRRRRRDDSQAFPGTIGRQAAVVAPGLMVMGVILFMGRVSGAHLNPAVSIAFALRNDFQWRRVPGYIVVQLAGAALALPVPPAGDQRLRGRTARTTRPPTTRRRAAFSMEARAHPRSGERDPRHRVGCAERRAVRCLRSRRVHHARRLVGEPDLGRVDEPGPDLRTGPRRRRLHRLLGLRRRTAARVRSSPSGSRSCSRWRAGARPDPAPPRAASSPRSTANSRPDARR